MIIKASFLNKMGKNAFSLIKKVLKKSKLVRNLLVIRRDEQGVYLKKRSITSLLVLYSLLCFLLVDILGIVYAHISEVYAQQNTSQVEKISNSALKNCSMPLYDLNYCKIEPLKNMLQIPKAEAKEKENENKTDDKTSQKLTPSSTVKTAILGTKENTTVDSSLSEKHFLNPEVLFNLSNEHRQNLGIAPFEKNDLLCKIANERSPEVYSEIFITGRFHEGFRVRQFEYEITENIIFNRSETGAFNWWLSSPLHRNSIEGKYKYSCVACTENTCVQLFANYEDK